MHIISGEEQARLDAEKAEESTIDEADVVMGSPTDAITGTDPEEMMGDIPSEDEEALEAEIAAVCAPVEPDDEVPDGEAVSEPAPADEMETADDSSPTHYEGTPVDLKACPEPIEIGTKVLTYVEAVDEIGAGGARHKYAIYGVQGALLGEVNFQNGPVQEAGGVNGVFMKDLLAIVAHRLACFQVGSYGCVENDLALAGVMSAINALRMRTDGRQERGVEGTNEV